MTIANWLAQATAALASRSIATARLDALVLLGDTFDKDKSWVLAHDTDTIPDRLLLELTGKLKRREKREPLAYIRGKQAFYGRDFAVSPAVLIPRPETEAIIDILKSLPLQPGDSLIDVGTGSGAIAITAKLELPEIAVTASDISPAALAVARQNAAAHSVSLSFIQQDLLTQTTGSFTCIVANLPYVDSTWQRSPETDFEPHLALFAKDGGLELIKKLINQSASHSTAGDYLLLEADPRQHGAIIASAKPHFQHRQTSGFIVLLQRI